MPKGDPCQKQACDIQKCLQGKFDFNCGKLTYFDFVGLLFIMISFICLCVLVLHQVHVYV